MVEVVFLLFVVVSVVKLACMGRKRSSRSSLTSGTLLRSGSMVDRDIRVCSTGFGMLVVVAGGQDTWMMSLTRRVQGIDRKTRLIM